MGFSIGSSVCNRLKLLALVVLLLLEVLIRLLVRSTLAKSTSSCRVNTVKSKETAECFFQSIVSIIHLIQICVRYVWECNSLSDGLAAILFVAVLVAGNSGCQARSKRGYQSSSLSCSSTKVDCPKASFLAGNLVPFVL